MIKLIALDNSKKTYKYLLRKNATIHSICVYNSIYNNNVKHNYPLVKLNTQLLTSTDSTDLTSKKIVPYSNKIELLDYPITINDSLKLLFSIELQQASNYIGSVNVIINYS